MSRTRVIRRLIAALNEPFDIPEGEYIVGAEAGRQTPGEVFVYLIREVEALPTEGDDE